MSDFFPNKEHLIMIPKDDFYRIIAHQKSIDDECACLQSPYPCFAIEEGSHVYSSTNFSHHGHHPRAPRGAYRYCIGNILAGAVREFEDLGSQTLFLSSAASRFTISGIMTRDHVLFKEWILKHPSRAVAFAHDVDGEVQPDTLEVCSHRADWARVYAVEMNIPRHPKLYDVIRKSPRELLQLHIDLDLTLSHEDRGVILDADYDGVVLDLAIFEGPSEDTRQLMCESPQGALRYAHLVDKCATEQFRRTIYLGEYDHSKYTLDLHQVFTSACRYDPMGHPWAKKALRGTRYEGSYAKCIQKFMTEAKKSQVV